MSKVENKETPTGTPLVNPLLAVQSASGESELKDFIINFTGNKVSPNNNEVSINMISEVMAAEFPEFAYAFAEENFVRGYELGLEDASKLFKEQTKETK
jgi:hypothetical protein